MVEADKAWLDALLAASRRGDRAEFERLFVACQAMILRSAKRQIGRRLRGRVAPEDIAQEVQIAAWQELPRMVFENLRPFRAWIDRAVHNRLVSQGRHEFGDKRGVQPLSLEKTEPGTDSVGVWLREAIAGSQATPSKEASRREEIDGLPALLRKIPRGLREILQMAHFEGLSHAEISSRTGQTPDAVRKAISRAYEACRKIVGPGKGLAGGAAGA